MIGLLILIACIISVGSAFYRLAHDHYRNEWPMAILGGGVFFASQLVFGFIIVMLIGLSGNLKLLGPSYQLVLAVIIYAISGIACWILYYLLKKNWEKNPRKSKENDGTIDNF